MVTVESKAKGTDDYMIDFNGLSTDTKPVDVFEGMKIGNGSTFMEMDTKKLKFWDNENNEWV